MTKPVVDKACACDKLTAVRAHENYASKNEENEASSQ